MRELHDMGTTVEPRPDRMPLVVDVDGTLLCGDLSAEHILRGVMEVPCSLPAALVAIWQGGRAGLKSWLVEHVTFDVSTVPANPEVKTLIEAARADGRPIVLASASDRRLVAALDAVHGPFDAIMGSENGVNLSGPRKAAALVEIYGHEGFDYVGDSLADRAVWASARRAIVVESMPRLAGHIAAMGKLDRVITSPRRGRALMRALRPHQWLKNLLVFLPLIAGQQLDALSIAIGIVTFVAFSLTASAGYLINDLLDLPNDRRHPTKSARPLAAGLLTIQEAIAVAAGLLVAGLVIAAMISLKFFGILTFYFVMTCGYSLYLKRLVMVDVMVLAILYTLRMLAGGIAVGVPISDWLLAFSQLFFLSLAIVKRLVELQGLEEREVGEEQRVAGRGYIAGDLAPMGQLAAASALGASTVLALYINSDQVTLLYNSPNVLWAIWLVLIFWVGRLLVLAHRGVVQDDPVLFAATDRTTLLLGAFGVIILIVATL